MSRGSNQIKAGEKASPGTLSGKLEHNLKIIRSILGESNDIIIREMKISSNAKVDAAVIYIDGLVDRDLLNRDILQPLMFNLQLVKDKVSQNHSGLLGCIKSSVLTVGQIEADSNIDSVISGVMKGYTAILAQGSTQALVIDTKGWEKRAIESPTNEISMRGPKDSFTETMRINTALLRR